MPGGKLKRSALRRVECQSLTGLGSETKSVGEGESMAEPASLGDVIALLELLIAAVGLGIVIGRAL